MKNIVCLQSKIIGFAAGPGQCYRHAASSFATCPSKVAKSELEANRPEETELYEQKTKKINELPIPPGFDNPN